MKTNFKYILVITALILVGFSSCKEDEDKPIEGQKTNMNLKISQVKRLLTRDNNANNSELIFNVVDIFIYNTSNSLITHAQLNGQKDFTEVDEGTGVYVGNKSIETTTGDKVIYVGINLPTSIVAQIIEDGPNSKKTISSLEELTNKVDGFAMFSDKPYTTTLVLDSQDPANTINAQVKRLVAKVAVQAGSGLSYNVPGGVISNIYFNIGNINTRYFPVPQLDGTTVKDPNWNSQDAGVIKAADFIQSNSAEYIPINSSLITENKDLEVRYMTENTSQNQFQDELTYVSIRARFIPNKMIVYTNGFSPDEGFSEADYQGTPSMYCLKKANGFRAYGNNRQIMEDYAVFIGMQAVDVIEYRFENTYYNLYLNPKNKYDVLRNDFYKVTISKINGIGNPSPDDGGHIPLEEPTDINVIIDILDWNLIDWETQLPGSK